MKTLAVHTLLVCTKHEIVFSATRGQRTFLFLRDNYALVVPYTTIHYTKAVELRSRLES